MAADEQTHDIEDVPASEEAPNPLAPVFDNDTDTMLRVLNELNAMSS